MPHDPGPAAVPLTGRTPGSGLAAVVIPLRSFAGGKARLASHLDATARTHLARDMAERVVDAASDHLVVVVSSADDVRVWAHDRGLPVVDDPGSLDAAARAGVEYAAALGAVRAVVAHADLPLVTTFELVAGDGDDRVAVIVPCHRGDGTPVLSVPVDVPFTFAYGPGSFVRHCDEARRAGLEVRVVRDRALSFDIDVPEDLAHLERLSEQAHVQP